MAYGDTPIDWACQRHDAWVGAYGHRPGMYTETPPNYSQNLRDGQAMLGPKPNAWYLTILLVDSSGNIRVGSQQEITTFDPSGARTRRPITDNRPMYGTQDGKPVGRDQHFPDRVADHLAAQLLATPDSLAGQLLAESSRSPGEYYPTLNGRTATLIDQHGSQLTAIPVLSFHSEAPTQYTRAQGVILHYGSQLHRLMQQSADLHTADRAAAAERAAESQRAARERFSLDLASDQEWGHAPAAATIPVPDAGGHKPSLLQRLTKGRGTVRAR